MEDYGFALLDKLGVLKQEHNDVRYAAEKFIDHPNWNAYLELVKSNAPCITKSMRDYALKVEAEMEKIAPAVKQYKLAYLLNDLKDMEHKFTVRHERFREKCPALMAIKEVSRGERITIKDLQGNMEPPMLFHNPDGDGRNVYAAEAHNINVINNWHKEEDECRRAFAIGGDTLINYLIEHDPEPEPDDITMGTL